MVLNQFADDFVGDEEVVLGNPVAVARADQGSVLQESSDVILTAIFVHEGGVGTPVRPEEMKTETTALPITKLQPEKFVVKGEQ